MHFILLSVACSVLVSVLLKLAPRRGWDVAQMVTWNYLAAALLCAWLLQPPPAALRQPGAPWIELLALALVLPTLFLVLAASVRQAGIVRTDVAQRLSLLLSLLAAFALFGEQAGAQKLLGLALGLCAVVGILARPDPHAAPGRSGWLLLLTVWIGFAVVDVMLKRLAMAGTPSAAALLVAFALAFAGMLAWQGWRRPAAGPGQLRQHRVLHPRPPGPARQPGGGVRDHEHRRGGGRHGGGGAGLWRKDLAPEPHRHRAGSAGHRPDRAGAEGLGDGG